MILFLGRYSEYLFLLFVLLPLDRIFVILYIYISLISRAINNDSVRTRQTFKWYVSL
jgi:hypothetical protein